MELILRVVDGPYTGQEVQVRQAEIVIGRDPNGTALMQDPQLSRAHAKLFFSNGQWYVADLGSTNGTFLNGTHIGPSPVIFQHGSTIAVGSSVMRAEMPKASSPVPPPVLDFAPPQRAHRPFGRELRQAMQTYEQGVGRILADGVLTPIEASEMLAVQNRLGLNDGDTLTVRATAFQRLVDLSIQNRRGDTLTMIPTWIPQLGLQNAQHRAVLTAIARAKIYYGMTCVRSGFLPKLPFCCLNLGPGEVCHMEVDVTWMAERMVDSGWQATTYHYGHADRSSTTATNYEEWRVVPISQGTLVITNERLVLVGNPNSFDVDWAQVLGIDRMADGLVVRLSSQAEALTLTYVLPEMHEVVASVVAAFVP